MVKNEYTIEKALKYCSLEIKEIINKYLDLMNKDIYDNIKINVTCDILTKEQAKQLTDDFKFINTYMFEGKPVDYFNLIDLIQTYYRMYKINLVFEK